MYITKYLCHASCCLKSQIILEVGSRHQNEACGNRWTWNKMDAKFGFCIKFYARIQIFRLLGPTELLLWLFKINTFFKNYMDFPYKNKSGGNFFPQVHFYMEKPYKNLRKRQFLDSCKNSLAGRIDPKFFIWLYVSMQNLNLASILFQVQRLPQASCWCREPTSRIGHSFSLFLYLVFSFTWQNRWSMQPILQFNHCNSRSFQQDNCSLFCTVELIIRWTNGVYRFIVTIIAQSSLLGHMKSTCRRTRR